MDHAPDLGAPIGLQQPDPHDLTQSLARAAQQDASRFEELCERVAPALVAWAELKVGAKLRGSIEPMDVVQETWCRAWRSFGSFDPDAVSFRAWTFRIAKNVVLECARRSRRERHRGPSRPAGRQPRDERADRQARREQRERQHGAKRPTSKHPSDQRSPWRGSKHQGPAFHEARAQGAAP